MADHSFERILVYGNLLGFHCHAKVNEWKAKAVPLQFAGIYQIGTNLYSITFVSWAGQSPTKKGVRILATLTPFNYSTD
ncbi:MAG: hypothetical protein K8F52_03230 [Candidatus Scalindua rubra]|nr:hypothetical protein [Candidatus Scalindua rubra]